MSPGDGIREPQLFARGLGYKPWRVSVLPTTNVGGYPPSTLLDWLTAMYRETVIERCSLLTGSCSKVCASSNPHNSRVLLQFSCSCAVTTSPPPPAEFRSYFGDRHFKSLPSSDLSLSISVRIPAGCLPTVSSSTSAVITKCRCKISNGFLNLLSLFWKIKIYVCYYFAVCSSVYPQIISECLSSRYSDWLWAGWPRGWNSRTGRV
jgi:hypothetical protein